MSSDVRPVGTYTIELNVTRVNLTIAVSAAFPFKLLKDHLLETVCMHLFHLGQPSAFIVLAFGRPAIK